MRSVDILAFSTPEFTSGLVAGLAVGGLAVRQYMKSPLHDQGFSVYSTPDIETLEAVLEACAINGLEPEYELPDEKVIRAIMNDGRTVFNVTREDVWDEMGNPAGAPMLRVKDPYDAAQNAQCVFRRRGFEDAEIIEPMEDQTKGKMFFVKTAALPWLLGFREHVIRMGERPKKWNPLKTLQFARSK